MSSMRHSHLPHLFLKPGELFLSCTPAIVATVLGSCVSITISERTVCLGAMCHVLLPTGSLADGFRYVDSTLDYMVEKIDAMGVRLGSCEVKMFGGADVLVTSGSQSGRLSVGRQNVEEARRRLSSLGVVPKVSDVGGKYGRKLFFNSHTGEVFMKKMSKSHF